MRLIFVLLLIFYLPWLSNAASPKRALKLLEKDKFEKVEKQLEKILSKDSISPGAHYVYSLLYLDTGYQYYHIDTSWFHIQKSLTQIKFLDEKALKKLGRASINDSTILRQKLRVDTAAFVRAKRLHTIEGYDYFIENHPTAPQFSQAIDLRNEIAWQNAKSTNTYESYLYFINTYPDARQIKEAVELYDILLYREKTKSGLLQDYEDFLKKNPKTPYRSDAELNILKLSCTSNSIENYKKFLQKYPQSTHANLAMNFLYHTFTETHEAGRFFNNFLFSPTDSLERIIALEDKYWIPVLDENTSKYGFRDQEWNKSIDYQYQEIPQEYLCGNIISDVLQIGNDQQKKIIGRNGEVIWSQPFDGFEDIGYGFLKINSGNQIQLLHKSGYHLKDVQVDDAGILGGKFIRTIDNNKSGLITFFGLPLLEPTYDDIFFQEGLIMFEKNGMNALAKPETIEGILKGEAFTPRFLYDEVEVLDNGMIRAYRKEAETILDQNLQTVIPFEKHQIYQVNQGWLIKKDKKYQVLNENLMPITDTGFKQVQYNDRWLALQKENKWSFLAPQAEVLSGFVYDSVRIISDNFAYLAIGDSSLLYTVKGKPALLQEVKQLQLLKDVNLSNQSKSATEFIAVKLKTGNSQVYNSQGEEILTGKFDHATALGNEYLVVEYRNKALYDTAGNQLLRSIYDGIGNYNNGFVSLLRNKKFGIYNNMLGVEISPKYNAMLRPFADSLIMAAENGRWGLLDLAGDKVLDFKYQKIESWNDTSVLAMNLENIWQVIALSDETVLVDGIDEYHFIKNVKEEKIIRINSGAQYGIYSNNNGEIIPPTRRP